MQKDKKAYHHGDLRTQLLEKGIEMIDKNGLQGLSLRKLAAECNVSHAAPYAHFKNKEALINEIESYIANKWATVFRDAIKNHGINLEGLTELCVANIMFFVHNKHYYSLFESLGTTMGTGHEYEPFDIFAEYTAELFEKIGLEKELHKKTFAMYLAMLQGLTSLAIAQDAPREVLEVHVRDLLTTNYLLY